MSKVVTKLAPISSVHMIIAAHINSLRVLRTRWAMSAPEICGITETPVSKPDMPSANLGKTKRETAISIIGPPP